MEKRKWNIEKIIEESRVFWIKHNNFSPTYIFKNDACLHFQIYRSGSVLGKLKELEGSKGNKRWLWVVRQLGLRAVKKKIRVDESKPCYWKWIVTKV